MKEGFMKNIILVCGLLMMSACGFGNGEKGKHRGVVTDVSESGWICKTMEAQIISGAGNAAIHYEVTVLPSAVKALQDAQTTGKEVIVEYESPRIFSLCNSGHSNIVTAVEPYTGK